MSPSTRLWRSYAVHQFQVHVFKPFLLCIPEQSKLMCTRALFEVRFKVRTLPHCGLRHQGGQATKFQFDYTNACSTTHLRGVTHQVEKCLHAQ